MPIDPRVVRTHEAVTAAAGRLLLDEGWSAVTHARVAELADVSKVTVYKHWPDGHDLVRAGFAAIAELPHHEPTGDLRHDLVEELKAYRGVLRAGFDRVLVGLAERARADEAIAELRDEVYADGLAPLRRWMSAVVDDDVAALLADVVCGTLTHRIAVAGGDLADDELEQVADLAMAVLHLPPPHALTKRMQTMSTILMVLTSNGRLGDTGEPTGWFLPEAAHPWKVFDAAGHAMVWASPDGGHAPMEGVDRDDETQVAFLEAFGEEGPETVALAEVDASDVDAVFVVGGHGTMWDLPGDADLQRLLAAVHEGDGVVAAVCHGPAALVDVELGDGSMLLAGKQVTGFTDREERAVERDEIVPFLLASTMVERGATHHAAPDFTANVVVDGRLVTGQNPASATGTAEAVVDVLGG